MRLSDTEDLVTPVIDNEKRDLRVSVKIDSYTGARKKSLRFHLSDDNWLGFEKIIDKIDKEYPEIA